MKDVYVIFWSSTGNTETMANAVGEGITGAGGTAHVIPVSEADASVLKDADSFALGASAMGAEELDPEMDDFVVQAEAYASGKTIGLFGSYDWGDGDWMRQWTDRMEAAGAKVAGREGVIARLEPDEEAIEACKALGEALVK